MIDAQYLIEQNFYKIGFRNMVFRWTGQDWVRSTATVTQLIRAATRINPPPGDPM